MLFMNKYQIKKSIGSGNFSKVYQVEDPSTSENYALKVMKTHHKIALRQAKILSKMNHPNVIKLFNFQQNQNQSKLLLQFVGINTLELYQAHSFGLRQQQVKCILFQAALGLAYVHSFGIINRDVKPENILIDKKNALVKIIDFGLAISQKQVSTDYIATRWYRAPQNLLGTKQYSCSVDVFSLACVIVQLYLGGPLFPGSDNVDQIYKIFNILGYPTEQQWPLGYQRACQLGIKINSTNKKTMDLNNILNPCDPLLVELVQKMLKLDPSKRIKCSEIIRHPYFKDVKIIVPPFVYQRFQQDHLGKTPKSNTTYTKTSSAEPQNTDKKTKFDKIAFKGIHQIKQPRGSIKQSIQQTKNPLNKQLIKHYPSSSNLKSIEQHKKLNSKKKSSISSIQNKSFQSKSSKLSKNNSFDHKITHFPTTLIKNRNKTSKIYQNSSIVYNQRKSQTQGQSIINNFDVGFSIEHPHKNQVKIVQRLARNYSQTIQPLNPRFHPDHSVRIQRNSNTSQNSNSRQCSVHSRNNHRLSPPVRIHRSPGVMNVNLNPNIHLRIVKNQTQIHLQQNNNVPSHLSDPKVSIHKNQMINNMRPPPIRNIHQSPQRHSHQIQNYNNMNQNIASPSNAIRINNSYQHNNVAYKSPEMHLNLSNARTQHNHNLSPNFSNHFRSPEKNTQDLSQFSPHNNNPHHQKYHNLIPHNFSAPLKNQPFPIMITPRQFKSPPRLHQVHNANKFFDHKNNSFRGGSPENLHFQRKRFQNINQF